MSTTTSEPAAALVAAAIAHEAAASAQHRRLHLGRYLGIEPEAVFSELMNEATASVEIEDLGEAGQLVALDGDGVLLIPYLVTAASAAGANRGSQGFGAALRSHFASGAAAGERRVLLILDPNPVETVSTASEAAADLPALDWRRLCGEAVAVATGTPVEALLAAVAADFAKYVGPDGAALARLAAFAGDLWASERDAGEDLYRLGLYLRDPEVGRDLKQRLKEGRDWRAKIDGWAQPGVDLAKSLRRALGGDVRAVRKIADAVRPFGIDYRLFTLDDLKSSEPQAPSFARPLIVRGPEAVAKTGDERRGARRMASSPRLIAWYRASGSLALRLAGDFDGRETAEIRWADGGTTALDLDTAAMEGIGPIEHVGWRFGRVVLERDGDLFDTLDLTVFVEPGSWFPVEQALFVDVDQEAFIVEGEPTALAIARGGGVLGPVALDDVAEVAGERVLATARSADGETHELPLLMLGEGPEAGTGEPEDEDEDEDEDAELPPPATREVASPVHALLDYARRHGGELGDLTFRAEQGKAYITVSGDLYRLAEQSLGRLNGLAVEAEVLRRPENWAFTAVGGDGEIEVLPDVTLERLALGSIPADAAAAFAAARAAFFAACAPYGSAYAVAAGIALAEARAYVEAFAALVAALPAEGRYQAEFDRLLLLDAVTVLESDELYLAPTNPVTVAFYLTFGAAAARWASAAGELRDSDLAAISPAYLMPLVMRGGVWHEVATPSPFLWRRFQRAGRIGTAGEEDGRAMSARLKFFLDVYEAYDEPGQTLAITVVEPGDGVAVVDALRRFYQSELRQDDYTLPRLDVTLASDDGALPPAIHDLLAGGEGSTALDRLVRSRVKITTRPPGRQGFSHLTFAFRAPAPREPAEVDMSTRSTSLYSGGLAAAPGRVFSPGANVQSFAWGTFGAAPAGSVATDRVAELLPVLARRTLELVGGQPNALLQPNRTRMPATQVERGFMPDIYEQSVWVVHLDHLLGLEAFAPDPNRLARYLIDYEERPDASHAGLSAVTATQRVEPYLDALSGALRELGSLTDKALARILRLLNSVSGRWALQMLRQSREQILERIGTVTAIAAVQELDLAFAAPGGAGLLLPLEEILRVVPRNGLPRQTQICDDLLYVRLPFDGGEGPLVVRGRLLEVKYRSGRGPNLGEARQEIENSHRWLTEVFNDGGPGRLFRARDLAELLRTSAARGVAFGLMPPLGEAAAADFERALERIASGDYVFELRFWVDDEELVGDVISVELESDSGATRSALPGAGAPAGLVRLGRRALAALATGEPLPVPDEGWSRPLFSPPDEEEAVLAEPAPEPAPWAGGEQPAEPAADEGAVREEQPREARAVAPEEMDEVRQLARALDAAALKYRLELEPFQPALAQVGPSVIRFRARPLGSQSLEGVTRRSADLGREIGAAEGVLVGQEPYFITIDVPRREREVIRFSDYSHLLGDPEPGALKFLVGMAASGEVTIADLARLPHLLLAGATGSGKSVFLRSLLCSLLEQHGAMELSVLLVDPKQIDFLPFEDLPHLADGRIIFDPAEAVALLGETIDREIERRRPMLKRAGVTNVLEYYEAGGSPLELPQMVIVVDEFADLASTLGRGERAEFMSLIQRYGQLTRAFGIYLVLATQRPSVQVITGDIKANLTARVALKVQAPQDSVTILGHGGAESLRDKGDLLFEHGGRSERLQGFMVTPQDVAAAVARWSRP